MSYALVSYAVVVGGIATYLAWLARTRRQLGREVAARSRTNRG